jgi:WD repeat-containing protein 48
VSLCSSNILPPLKFLPQHCAGINSVVISPDASTLWTASRDSIIKKWSIPSSNTASSISATSSPTLETDYEGHIDWVNSITLLNRDALVSCSSDKTIRVWKAQGEEESGNSTVNRSEACLCGHTDYITSLAAATSRPLVASGGLGGEVFLWDVENLSTNIASTPVLRSTRSTSTNTTSTTVPSSPASSTVPSAKIEGIIGSVYSLAIDSPGNILTAGTSDGCIWLMDSRTGRVEAQLRGHSETVRALCMRPDASALLSGSSDHTIRAWDLRQRRAFSTLAVHTDSVWALAPADSSLESIYSGGRDGCVYCTHVASKMSQLVAEERNPVTALAPMSSSGRHGSNGNGVDSLWVATTSSTINCWNVDPSTEVPSSTSSTSTNKHSFIAGALPAVRSRMTFANSSSPTTPNRPPLHPSSSISSTITGAPPIRQIAVLTNRRHVLTQDAEENILLWDLSIGAPVKDLGKIGTLQDAERQLFDPAHNVWPWFQPDTRLGCLAGVMESPGCFLAEAYKRDLGDAAAAADAKVNMAQYMLGALFAKWAEKRTGEEDVGRSGGGGGGDQQMMDVDEREEASNIPASPSTSTSISSAVAFSLRCELPPVIMVSGGNGAAPWRRTTDAFDGTEAEGDVIPQWVADCVLRKKIPTGKDLKMAFILIPAAKSGLPSLLQSKLNAPRVLGIDKVADYVMRKMADQGIHLAEEPLFWSPEKQALWEEEQRAGGGGGSIGGGGSSVEGGSPSSTKGGDSTSGGTTFGSLINIRQLRPISASTTTTTTAAGASSNTNQALLITCGGAAVPWDFTLAAVKQWMWKRPEDLKLEYAIREPGTQLKTPVIRPPS